MPSIPVVPEDAAVESSTGGPVLAGVQLRRAVTLDESIEPLRSSVTLGSGSERVYDRGIRGVWSLAWSKLTETQAVEIRELTRRPFVTFQPNAGGPTYVVGTGDGAELSAIPATHPVRFNVSLTLRERDPRP